jgi:hypothetical protein
MLGQRDIKIANFEIAQKKIIKELVDLGFELKDIVSINRDRYIILVGINRSILLTFKRDPFFTFGKMFQHLGYKDGELGDTINQEDLDTAIRLQVSDIISVFENGLVYTIPLWEFMEKSIKWVNKEQKPVRSISLNKYKKLNIDNIKNGI